MLKTVKVPKEFEPIFEKAQEFVSRYFKERKENAEEGTIQIFGQRYIYVRAASMSVEFFEMIKNTYRDKSEEEALAVARSLLFDVAHAIGVADARNFHSQLHLKDPIEKLSAGPVHFAHAGWAFVDIHPESLPSPDEHFYLVYDHPYSFESDAWLQAKKQVDFPVCIMNAGYSSGWCEESFGVKLVASEILCKAKGDEHCRFIMAHPSHIESRIQAYLKSNQQLAKKVSTYEIPGFFSRKKAEDELRKTLEELERRVEERTNELSQANARLLKEIEERKKIEQALRESEERYRQFIAYSAEGIYRVEMRRPVSIQLPEDEQVRLFFEEAFIAECNLSMAHMYGFETQEEAIGVPINRLLIPTDPHNIDYMRKFIHGGYRYTDEESHEVDKLGRPKYFLNNAIGFIENGYLTQVWGTQRDITERRLAESALSRSERYYRSLIENALDLITILNADGTVRYESPSIAKIFGFEPNDLIGKHITEFVHPDDRARLIETFRQVAARTQKVVNEEFRFLHKNGSWRILEVTGHNMLDDPVIAGIVVNSRDITIRKQAEQALQESEQQYRALVEQSSNPVYVLIKNKVVLVNAAWEELFGYKREEVLADTFDYMTLIAPESWAVVKERMARRMKGLPVVPKYEMQALTKDGRHVYLDVSVAEITWRNQPAVQGMYYDITHRKRAEAALAAEKEQLAVTLRSIGDGVITTDTEGRVVLLNKVAEHLTGWTSEEAIGQPVETIFNIIRERTGDRAENPLYTALQSRSTKELTDHTALISKDGAYRLISDSAAPILDSENNVIGAVLVFRDITEKHKLEQERAKASKLESVGILAGGIAHDFNNILTAILGNLSLMKMALHKPNEIQKRVNEAEKASLRARDLTQQLLTFSKGGAPVKSTSSIRELIKDSSDFALRGSNISCDYTIASGLWPADVDQGQISQVIHNLILNAVQAMPEGGKVEVNASNLRVTPAMGLPLREGPYLQIVITDHGIGIPPEHLSKIFDPYFTTKQKGSGLGLATSYSIVKNHDGFIGVTSELGKGTSFTVYLPAVEKEIQPEPSRTENEFTGLGKILIMDDEDDIRTVMTHMLKRCGYTIVSASDGAEAIDLYTRAKLADEPFDLVIMDLTIPGGIGGKEAMERLRKFDPAIKAIVISGYSNDPVMSDYRSFGFSGVIPKPFDMLTLSKTVKEMLASAD